MKGPYNPRLACQSYTYENAAANKIITVTLTPKTGHYIVLKRLDVSFTGADPTYGAGGIAVEIKIGATSVHKQYLRAAKDLITFPFDDGIYDDGAADTNLVISVGAAGAAAKTRVNIIADQGHTGAAADS